eukprot:CAMPEP_0170647582 /NCGR_PEP_ID=MMETSP0224-20130122/44262_1 /TAXON_ID=285029 /ORGANISM="Togula jolla, Strain CCCM 725" /LENGTH=78 /DNA_ID=CAMNT_0010979019 /DNA_START=535 /DNA_END=768 /DNA_ORIENTATION=+
MTLALHFCRIAAMTVPPLPMMAAATASGAKYLLDSKRAVQPTAIFRTCTANVAHRRAVCGHRCHCHLCWDVIVEKASP